MYDSEFFEFVDAYPASRRCATIRAKAAFINARQSVSFPTLLRALDQHKRSDQWQRHIVPSMVTWLEEGRWIQVLPEPEPLRDRVTPWQMARRLGLK